MDYNVNHDFVYPSMLYGIVSREDPDILTLNEVSREEVEALEDIFATAFYAESPGRTYGNGVAWKPTVNVTSLQSFITGWRNSLIRMVTDDFVLYLTHLSALPRPDETQYDRYRYEEKRLDEIKRILELAKDDRSFFIVGDLNSLSPNDNYDITTLENQMRELNNPKFGIPVQFLVIPHLEERGLVDVLAEWGARESTVPTKEGVPEKEKRQHFMPLRLDYIFATSDLAETTKHAIVVKNRFTEKCSDHYPIVADFDV